MTEKQFIKILKQNLKGLSEEDQIEILSDYNEHFLLGKESGKDEEEICISLGDPAQIGKNSRVELLMDKAEQESAAGNVFKAVVASFSLGFFNIVFVLGPYLGLAGVMIGLWGTSVSLMLSGLICSLAVIFRPLILIFIPFMTYPVGFGINLALFLAGIALFSLGSLAVIGMTKISKLFYRGTVKYLQSNLKIIKRSR
ncbi:MULTISPECIES: HAAS domain-containing protein [unclassified Oceanispirochaeta]|uniref:HAAS signaling domain-containing protein n=1 Tax=unclassified Oceanispirochaeta TaxID=2635722 RepID=UPI000E09D71E|nr:MULTISPECIES: DUF1700 domain-containing protein [unclassified Oceanispirochaeta]MBF9016891.1 DUF1700 domain-containing protein [Oceanispirochaeta sp. M2]NPD73254.1 DUF1700 domain-containing protein [Oceanispirochaeta sp. M1]RDG31120.1 DUF1700 domain-containing protein [Oceanispirochaeta sp. M1]